MLTSFCASPAQRKKAFVTSVLVNLAAARLFAKASDDNSVISISRAGSSDLEIMVTLQGSL